MKAAHAAIRTQLRTARPHASTSSLPHRATFSTSRRTFAAEQQQQQQQTEGGAGAGEQKSKAKPEPEPDTTVAGRSPFQAFVDVLKDEVRKNREWQDSVKQLGGEVQKAQDSEAMKRAKEVYERARVSNLTSFPSLHLHCGVCTGARSAARFAD